VKSSPLFGKYETPIDRRSAYEILSERAKAAAAEAAMEEEKSDLAEDPMQREFATARRYSGTSLDVRAVSGSKMWDRHWVKRWLKS
jgi:hypothetical protein